MQSSCAVSYVRSSVASTTFFHIISKRHYFQEKKMLLNIKYVFWFSLQIWSETFLIPRRHEGDITINAQKSSFRVSVILVRFWQNLDFRNIFSKILKYKISRKFFRWEPRCATHTDEQIGAMKLIVAFRNFAKTPNIQSVPRGRHSPPRL